MGAVVSLDGFIADDNDDVGPLFDWYGNGDVTWSFPRTDDEARSTQASADFMRSHYRDVAAVVIGRRLFDLTHGWDGKPAADGLGARRHRTVHLRRRRREGHCRRQGVRRRPGRRRGRRSDRQPGAQARADRPGGRQPGPGGLRLRPPVLRHRRLGRAAAARAPDHDRARRSGHPLRIRREPLRPARGQRQNRTRGSGAGCPAAWATQGVGRTRVSWPRSARGSVRTLPPTSSTVFPSRVRTCAANQSFPAKVAEVTATFAGKDWLAAHVRTLDGKTVLDVGGKVRTLPRVDLSQLTLVRPAP